MKDGSPCFGGVVLQATEADCRWLKLGERVLAFEPSWRRPPLSCGYLVTHDAGLSTTALVCFALLGLLGFYIFRAANSQKDAFRRDPTAPAVRHIKSITTQRGTNLMVSGWWGLARKINYTGDWLFGLSWSLFAGFGSVLPYFYPIYFGVLLVHRAWRDDHMCQEKYGEDWARFKKLVPYVFVPYLF